MAASFPLPGAERVEAGRGRDDEAMEGESPSRAEGVGEAERGRPCGGLEIRETKLSN